MLKNVLRSTGLAAAAAGLVLATMVAGVSAEKADKVDVCHVDELSVVNMISVSGNAVAAHLAHGDTLAVDGSCQAPE